METTPTESPKTEKRAETSAEANANFAPGPIASDPSHEPWSNRIQGWSSKLVVRSREISKEVQSAGENLVGNARDRASVWTLRRERVKFLQSVGEQIFAAKAELSGSLSDSVVADLDRISAIDEELRTLEAPLIPATPSDSTPSPASHFDAKP